MLNKENPINIMDRKLLILALSLVLFAACKSGGEKGGKTGDFEIPDEVVNEGVKELEISEEVMQDIVQNLSSPVEMAALIKSLNVTFSNKYLASVDNIDQFSTSFQQAFNLGIYGADLGYLNMYNKTNSVIDYISAIKTLADGIKVGQFFDFVTLKRLAQNNENLDSLMYISVHSFNQVDKYLRTNNRSNLSALMITGVWVEGLYLATQVYREVPHPALKERIGEQKIMMADLLLILNNYKHDKQFESLINDLTAIKELYSEVTITYEPGEPEAVEQDGMLVIIQNEKSIVNISDETIAKIITKTEEIRNKLISM